MSSLPKCRRVKRPTTIAKRSQLAKKNFYKKRSYKPLCEKLKGNNNALAKALSKEKQECQYLFSQNVALTSEVQELGVACNTRDDIISVVLKNAKDTLALLVTLTGHVTNTIASCQQIVSTSRFTPRKSTTTERRESNRRLSGKSPARGVVQPMVGGYTITKPTINLSRLNIQREYRIQNPPNLSDIDESLTPEQSPSNNQTASTVRSPISRSLKCVPRRVDRLPERLQHSIRTSDESDRRSSVRSNRNSARHSLRRSRRDSEVAGTNIQSDERLKSPRVSLHDVSRLLQNAQSVNVRKILETASVSELSESQRVKNSTTRNSSMLNTEDSPNGSTIQNLQRDETFLPSCADESKSKRRTSLVINDVEDPLEGPSWLLNDSEVASSFEDPVMITSNDSSMTNDRASKKICEIRSNHDNSTNRRGQKENKINGHNDDDKEVEKTTNVAKRWVNPRERHFYRNVNDEDDRTDTNIPNFVTRKRGSHCDDTEDFTLMWRGPTATNYQFDINDLELPVIESPIVKATQARLPEPELTANIQKIATQNFANLTNIHSTNNEDAVLDNTIQLPPSPLLLDIQNNLFDSNIVEQNERSDDDDNDDSIIRVRKRTKKNIVFDSPSESDWTPTPKRKYRKDEWKDRAKDPSSAKVVLLKLKDDRISKSSLSLESYDNRNGTSMYREPSSDSEASSNSSSIHSAAQTEVHRRPRRQKAPKNLKEPSLGKKLRRN